MSLGRIAIRVNFLYGTHIVDHIPSILELFQEESHSSAIIRKILNRNTPFGERTADPIPQNYRVIGINILGSNDCVAPPDEHRRNISASRNIEGCILLLVQTASRSLEYLLNDTAGNLALVIFIGPEIAPVHLRTLGLTYSRKVCD